MKVLQRSHFEAIHNKANQNAQQGAVVRANAKIHILKQFTTNSEDNTN